MPHTPQSAAVRLAVHRPRPGQPMLRLALVCLGVAAFVLALVALPGGLPPGVAVARLAGVALPVGLGLLRLTRRHDDRFAMLLVGAGALWSLTTLAESSASVPYSVGRVAVWLLEPVIVLLLLSFPWGRLTSAFDRRLLITVTLVALLLYVPSAFLAPFPLPTPWTTCHTTAGCPSDAFLLTSGATGVIDDVIRPLRESLTAVLFGIVALVVARRALLARYYLRAVLAPVVAIALVRAVGLAVYFPVRQTGPTSAFADALGWIYVLSLPLLTLAFAAGLLAVRWFAADALATLTSTLSSRPGARRLRDAMAAALRDPELEIAFWREADGTWVDATGHPLADGLREPPSGRTVTEIKSGGQRLAALTHDVEVTASPRLLNGVTAYIVAALNSDRLVTRLERSLAALARSRARVMAVADEERRRIERDLHDGAQQRLVALRIKLELLAERRAADSPAEAAELRTLEVDIEATLEEVRHFGRGVYPPLLADRGIRDALHAVARPAALPTSVDVRLSRRYAPEVESAVYFCAVEALQNACKHAHGASGVKITASGADPLRFEVRDDGAGFDPQAVPAGAGITNMRDRLGAVGGTLEVVSAPGTGTVVVGMIPHDAEQARAAARATPAITAAPRTRTR